MKKGKKEKEASFLAAFPIDPPQLGIEPATPVGALRGMGGVSTSNLPVHGAAPHQRSHAGRRPGQSITSFSPQRPQQGWPFSRRSPRWSPARAQPLGGTAGPGTRVPAPFTPQTRCPRARRLTRHLDGRPAPQPSRPRPGRGGVTSNAVPSGLREGGLRGVYTRPAPATRRGPRDTPTPSPQSEPWARARARGQARACNAHGRMRRRLPAARHGRAAAAKTTRAPRGARAGSGSGPARSSRASSTRHRAPGVGTSPALLDREVDREDEEDEEEAEAVTGLTRPSSERPAAACRWEPPRAAEPQKRLGGPPGPGLVPEGSPAAWSGASGKP